MKSSPNILKIKPKCPHKQSRPSRLPKTSTQYPRNANNYQARPVKECRSMVPKQTPLKNDQNYNSTNFELCKQATLCYYGLKEVMRMETLEKQKKRLSEQNKKLKEQNKVYQEYFTQFEKRFKDQKEQIKKLKQQNHFLIAKNAKIQELNSTLSGATATGRTHSHKDSYVTRSTPKYMF